MYTTAALGEPIGGSTSVAGAGGGASRLAAAVAVEVDGAVAWAPAYLPIGPRGKEAAMGVHCQTNTTNLYIVHLKLPPSPSPPNGGSHLNVSNWGARLTNTRPTLG